MFSGFTNAVWETLTGDFTTLLGKPAMASIFAAPTRQVV